MEHPFKFVQEALGVGVVWNDNSDPDKPAIPGYYLDAPRPEWLGADFASSMAAARTRVAAVELASPPKKVREIDWAGIGSKARSGLREALNLLDLVLPSDVTGASSEDFDDELPP